MTDRGYKRSWKNLLINKRYQLRFTLFMVGLSTLLMTGLGVWIMVVANETTKVAITSERGRCPKVPLVQAPYEEAPTPSLPPVPMKLDDDGGAKGGDDTDDKTSADKTTKGPKDTDDTGTGRHPKISVTLDEMQIPKPVLDKFGAKVVDHWICELDSAAHIQRLEAGRLHILYVLIGAGVLLVFGLAIYGIKMTHRVAGPLFKVQLYLAKMRDGRFDKVYNLRKGDQLVDFYEHFRHAHAGVVKLEKSDIERIKKVIVAAEAAGAGDHPSIGELRTLLERKEKSIE